MNAEAVIRKSDPMSRCIRGHSAVQVWFEAWTSKLFQSTLPIMHARPLLTSIAVIFFASLATWLSAEEEPSIDRLLNKLPPPEKLASHPVHSALQQNDPAAKDKLVQDVLTAVSRGDFPRALNTARKLAGKYPTSVGAACLRGMCAWRMRQYEL